MVTEINTPETKPKRKPRASARAAAAQSTAAAANTTPNTTPNTTTTATAKARRPRRPAVDKNGVEDAAYAPAREDTREHSHEHSRKAAQAEANKQRLSQLMARGKDLVSGDAASIATTAAIVVGAALIEVELIPGLIIGAGAILLGKVFPELGSYARPAVKGAIRAGFFMTQKAREVMAETTEQMHDLVAEVMLEQAQPKATKKAAPAAQPSQPAASAA